MENQSELLSLYLGVNMLMLLRGCEMYRMRFVLLTYFIRSKYNNI